MRQTAVRWRTHQRRTLNQQRNHAKKRLGMWRLHATYELERDNRMWQAQLSVGLKWIRIKLVLAMRYDENYENRYLSLTTEVSFRNDSWQTCECYTRNSRIKYSVLGNNKTASNTTAVLLRVRCAKWKRI